MERIASFCVDHTRLLPGMYLSRQDGADGEILTWDIRMKQPNKGSYLSPAAAHTLEHLFATYARNSKYSKGVVYVGPMGCLTGFYLLTTGLTPAEALDLTRSAFAWMAEYDGEIPGASAVECGNYLMMDPIAARADVEGMGLKNTGGYIFYDGNNGNWLDPSKPAARQYLCTLAAELAQQGFDEILLTDVGYPTVGKLDKIDYNGADRAASIRLFLEELRSALGEYGVAVSIELPPEVITSGADDTAGLVLSDIAPLVDRVYAVTTVDQIPALEAAVSAAGEDTDFVAELTGHSPDVTGSCLILAD